MNKEQNAGSASHMGTTQEESLVYGNRLDFWRAKVQEGLPPRGTFGRDNLLCQNQSRVHEAGFREASLVETIFGYSVRLRSGLSSNQVLFGGRMEGRTVPYEEALAWGKAWVDESPDFRVLTYGAKCDGAKPYGPCTLNYHKEAA